jgi:hypothetical protein
MDPEPTEPMTGLYTVRTRWHHHGDMTEDLTFTEAMRLIQDRFEQSNGAVHFASITRQE